MSSELPKHMTAAQFNEHIKTGRIKKVSAAAGSRQRPRHVPGEMNGLENEYSQYLDLRKRVGEIRDYRFERFIVVLAPRTTFKIDFAVQTLSGHIHLIDTKGFLEDDARVKIKVAADIFRGWFTFISVTKGKRGAWKEERF